MNEQDLYEISLAIARAEAELISARAIARWATDYLLQDKLAAVLDALEAIEIPDGIEGERVFTPKGTDDH